jgi:hypothetical protein
MQTLLHTNGVTSLAPIGRVPKNILGNIWVCEWSQGLVGRAVRKVSRNPRTDRELGDIEYANKSSDLPLGWHERRMLEGREPDASS